jgi:hypothetical protein
VTDERNPFKTEAELCAAFIAWATGEGWTGYAETGGWDIVLAHPDGTQIGVQAKMKFNIKVLDQTVPEQWNAWYDEAGPDFRAILLPADAHGAEKICGALGIRVFQHAGFERRTFNPSISMHRTWCGWHWWSPKQRIKLPAYVPDVPAGASGPSQLTEWKVAALKIAAVLELRGYVTRADFKRYSIDPRRWLGPPCEWIQPTDVPGRFERGPGLDFERQHPVVYPQVLEDVRAELAGMPADIPDGAQRRLVA